MTGRRWLTAGLLALVAAFGWRDLRALVAPDPPVLLEIRDDIRTLARLEDWPAAHGRFENAGFVPCRDGRWVDAGWCVPPGGSATLRYVLPSQPEARGLLLRLFFFRRDPGATSRLRVFREGEPAPRMTFENVHFADDRLDLSPALQGSGGAVVLSFEGENPTGAPDVLLQHVEIRAFSQPLPSLPPVWRVSLVVLALGMCWIPLLGWRRVVPLWSIVSMGFALRYYALTQVYLLPLDWDAVGYYDLAKSLRLFTDTGFHSAQFGLREPMFLLVVNTVLRILGDAQTHVRLVSFLGSLGLILMIDRVSRRLWGRPWGVLAAMLVAVSLPLVRESVRGLRLEFELLLLLALAEVLFIAPWKSLKARAGVAGLLAGALALTRVTYLATLAPILLYGLTRGSRWQGWLAAAAAVGIMLALVAPSRWNMYRQHGDAFEDHAQYARWLANAEFAGATGFPDKLEAWRKMDQGPRLAYGRYLFGLHTVPELVVGTLRGAWRMMRHMDIVAFHAMLTRRTGLRLAPFDMGFQLLGLFGLALAAVKLPALRWLPLMFLSLVLPIAFLYDRGLLEPWRHAYQAFPWVVIAAVLAARWVVHQCSARVGLAWRTAGAG